MKYLELYYHSLAVHSVVGEVLSVFSPSSLPLSVPFSFPVLCPLILLFPGPKSSIY